MHGLLMTHIEKYPGLRLHQALSVLSAIEARARTGKRCMVAIDGPCASGKTTLAGLLKEIYSCNVFSLDSFFLRPEQRTQARLAEPGGNVDYERAEEELLMPLRAGTPFTYRPYDCGAEVLAEPVAVTPGTLSIVEGVYSLHPRFADCYDLKLFLTVDPDEQARRLKARSPALYPRFVEEWLPMEKHYFETFRISDTCDLTL